MQRLREATEVRYRTQINVINAEGQERRKNNEIARFSHPLIRFGVFLASLLVFTALLQYTAPPKGFKESLKSIDHVPASKAELCFGVNCLNDSRKLHNVSLPFFNLQGFKDYQPSQLSYRFKPHLNADQFQRGINTLFIPKVWGDASVYRNGVLIASGPDLLPVITLESLSDEITVYVNTPSAGKFGIRGTIPPFFSDTTHARKLESQLGAQAFQIRYSLVAQLAGLCLLLIMYLTFPYRPELFAFLTLFGVETLRSSVFHTSDQGKAIFTPVLDKMVYGLLLFTGAIAIVFFVGTFFRRPLKLIYKLFKDNAIPLSLTSAVGYLALTSAFRELSGENALFVTLWFLACGISLKLTAHPLLYFFIHRHYARLVLSLATLLGVGWWAFQNIRDHFVLTTAITTEYNNHLHFFFLMATVLGIEIGRTEVRIKQAFSLLPQEVVGILQRKEHAWREGFVILLDVVGWSRCLKMLKEEDTPEYIHAVNKYLLAAFDIPGISVMQGTGDGFYLTLEGKPNELLFHKLRAACESLARTRPTCGQLGLPFDSIKNEHIIVRSAIGFGKYYIGFVDSERLQKEFSAGFIATRLARAIGSDKDPSTPRILLGSELDQYRGDRSVFETIEKQEVSQYWLFN